jgi:hypothetical protein
MSSCDPSHLTAVETAALSLRFFSEAPELPSEQVTIRATELSNWLADQAAYKKLGHLTDSRDESGTVDGERV